MKNQAIVICCLLSALVSLFASGCSDPDRPLSLSRAPSLSDGRDSAGPPPSRDLRTVRVANPSMLPNFVMQHRERFYQVRREATYVLVLVGASHFIQSKQSQLIEAVEYFYRWHLSDSTVYHLGLFSSSSSHHSPCPAAETDFLPLTWENKGHFKKQWSKRLADVLQQRGHDTGLATASSLLNNYFFQRASCTTKTPRDMRRIMLVFVSDKDDNSVGSVHSWLREYQSWLQDGKIASMDIMAIVGPVPGGCVARGQRIPQAPRYTAVVQSRQNIHGTITSICNTHWSEAWSPVLDRDQFSRQIHRFILSHHAIPDSLQVTVNNKLWAKTTYGWSYDPFSRAVSFDRQQFLPPWGSQIDVTYEKIHP